MSRFIIDTNVMIINPRILALNLKMIIPDVIMEELKTFVSKDETYNYIFEIVRNNSSNIHITKTNSAGIDFDRIFLDLPRLSKNDILIAKLAKEYSISHIGEEVFLVTQDKDLQYSRDISNS